MTNNLTRGQPKIHPSWIVVLAGMALGLVVGLGADTLGLRRTMLTGLGLLVPVA